MQRNFTQTALFCNQKQCFFFNSQSWHFDNTRCSSSMCKFSERAPQIKSSFLQNRPGNLRLCKRENLMNITVLCICMSRVSLHDVLMCLRHVNDMMSLYIWMKTPLSAGERDHVSLLINEPCLNLWLANTAYISTRSCLSPYKCVVSPSTLCTQRRGPWAAPADIRVFSWPNSPCGRNGSIRRRSRGAAPQRWSIHVLSSQEPRPRRPTTKKENVRIWWPSVGCVCVCVCLCVCLYVCMYVCIHIYMYICTYVWIFIYVHTYIREHIYIYLCIY